MNVQKYHFQWFEREDGRRALRASVGQDGKLRLGRKLREMLPERIRIGFDARAKALAIADGYGAGIDWPKCGTLSARALSAQIVSAGLRLPVSFLLLRDEVTGYFLGRIIPRRRPGGWEGSQYDMEQLQVLYQHILDRAVQQLGKSTPLSERRACAMEAFYTAAQAYRPGCGDLEGYLEEQVRRCLIRENRQYTAGYLDRSLDQPLGRDGEEGFCLYDTLSASSSGGIAQVEERVMLEQFLDTLPHRERRLLRLLQEGYSVSHIAGELALEEEEVYDLAREVGRKRRAFFQED